MVHQIVTLEIFLKMSNQFYDEINETNRSEDIRDIIRTYEKNNLWKEFDCEFDKIPKTNPPDSYYAFIIRKLAINP